MNTHSRVLTVLVGAVGLAGLLADPYTQLSACRILALGLVAVAVHQLSASTGLASLGHGAYFGAGAYTTALLSQHGWTSAPAHLVAAGITGGVLAGIAALALVKVRGLTYLVASLTVGLFAATVAGSWKTVTGGSDGIAAPPAVLWPAATALTDPAHVYTWTLLVCAGCMTVVLRRSRSPFAAALTGIGDSEPWMRALGYPVGLILWRAHLASGILAGTAGALWVHTSGYIAPHDLGLATGAIALAAAAIADRAIALAALIATVPLVFARDLAASYLGAATSGTLWFGLALLAAGFLPVLRARVRP